jgi:hypothetical protein
VAAWATMQKCDSRRRDGLVRSEPVVSRCAKRHLGAAASRRSSSPPSDGASYCTSGHESDFVKVPSGSGPRVR